MIQGHFRSILIKFLLISGLMLCGFPLFAGNQNENRKNDIGIIAGGYFPMYKNSGEGVVAGLTYSNWTSRGLGFRTGFQYISKATYVDNILGIPVAVAYRTKGKDPYARIDNALNSAAESDRYPYDSYSENMRNTFFNFLLGLFSNAEFYAGITPGYIIGNDSSTRSNSWSSGEKTHRQDSWTEVKNRFCTSLDAGMNLNFRIWRYADSTWIRRTSSYWKT